MSNIANVQPIVVDLNKKLKKKKCCEKGGPGFPPFPFYPPHPYMMMPPPLPPPPSPAFPMEPSLFQSQSQFGNNEIISQLGNQFSDGFNIINVRKKNRHGCRKEVKYTVLN